MDEHCHAGPEHYEEGFGFFFYHAGAFDLTLQNITHVIDPTTIIFNHHYDEWRLSLRPDQVIKASEIVVDESFIRDLVPDYNHQSILAMPNSRATTTHSISLQVQRLLYEIEQESPRILIESLKTALCADAIRQFTHAHVSWEAKSHPADAEITLVEEAKAILVNHLREDISLEALSAQLKMSPFHILRLFKKRTDQTPHQYLTHERINRAKKLLLDTDDGITQIAYKIGYQNPSHFTKQFRRKVGVNPREFRAIS